LFKHENSKTQNPTKLKSNIIETKDKNTNSSLEGGAECNEAEGVRSNTPPDLSGRTPLKGRV